MPTTHTCEGTFHEFQINNLLTMPLFVRMYSFVTNIGYNICRFWSFCAHSHVAQKRWEKKQQIVFIWMCCVDLHLLCNFHTYDYWLKQNKKYLKQQFRIATSTEKNERQEKKKVPDQNQCVSFVIRICPRLQCLTGTNRVCQCISVEMQFSDFILWANWKLKQTMLKGTLLLREYYIFLCGLFFSYLCITHSAHDIYTLHSSFFFAQSLLPTLTLYLLLNN